MMWKKIYDCMVRIKICMYILKNKETILVLVSRMVPFCLEYIKLDRDKSTFKSHRDFSSEIEITFKHF